MRTQVDGNKLAKRCTGALVTVVTATMLSSIAPLAAAESSQAIRAQIEADWVAGDARFSAAQADTGDVHPVTTAEDAAGGCDGVKNGRWGFHTASGEQDAWWQVDLGESHALDRIVIFNRTDRGTAPRTRFIRVLTAAESGAGAPPFEVAYEHSGEVFFGVEQNKPLVVKLSDQKIKTRFVRLQVPGRCSFALDEVEVYAAAAPERNLALGQPADQKSIGKHSYPGTLPEDRDAASPSRSLAAEFSLDHTRAVMGRAQALTARLHDKANAERLLPLEKKLDALNKQLEEASAAEIVDKPTRRELYFAARRLAREIAFTNPLLKMDRLLFIKRHDAAGVFHMCDQYYGCNAVPGGGLYILDDPFGTEPRLRDVLADSIVQNGRLKGQILTGGSFLSPELSFDGKTILFAYSQAKAWDKYQGKEAYEWTPECVYHIFKCNADGSDLQQLTHGAWDDFDPCFLPNGRIAFVSLRRGGYLRCGRHCPVYTLFSMNPDGSDIICLSFHETHEWQPSVNNDGMLVYTRWDYVDRDTNIAHHLWTSYPDGRDPRTFHGNYPERRESRPWMEMSIRAVPDSQKYVAATGAHHGHAFGSLVLIDPHVEDDLAMSQLERITPEVPFPESEGRPIDQYMVYGTPWPLSEDDFLCAYDPQAKNHGIYWIDRFGNKELLYRDATIASIDAIPLRARTQPPVVPDQTTQTATALVAAGGEAPPATVSLLNVYDSDFQWPNDTRITELRVVQVLPKTTPPPNQPRIGVANQTNARAVLGTVPVEYDGSAYFQVPAGKEVYFQALNEEGMAVQSMRSGTYLHPGEQLMCQGCHERKHRAPLPIERTPLAMLRPPSRITPDVDGSNPFNFVRLVQPVLDRHCVECHQKEKAIDLSHKIEGPHGWSRSYQNLAEKYGFYFHVSNGSIKTGVHGGSRTIAGQFGARASKLMDYLDKDHYGVQLSDEERHRFALWLDSNSEFYGSYENTSAQARGEIVHPTLD